jgi:hypothetical protein|tara:strand:- start:181 stop:567 length:387 start_codon:yes stop_codon:yes gene_type:complete
MNERELQAIVQKYSKNFEMLLENNSFAIDETKIFQTENPITEPTTRGGVYFAEMKELKVEAIVQDTSISKHLSKAMLGPNKEFLDIVLQASIDNKQTISLVTNLTNIMQNASKIHLFLTLKDAIIESQ